MSKANLQPADFLFWAVKQPISNTIQKLLLIVLADRANKHGLSHASHTTLAKDCGCAKRSIINAQRELEGLGLITISQRSKEGIKTSNLYRVNLVNSHVNVVPIDVKEMHNDVQEVHQGSERGALGVVKEVHIKHPSLNTQLNTYITPYIPPDQFDEFYSAYPKKVGRQAAVKAWKKLSPQPALINRILEDIRQRVEQGHWCTGKDKKYIPGPAPYLNGVMWEDEIIPKTGYTSPSDFAQLCADTQDLTENI